MQASPSLTELGCDCVVLERHRIGSGRSRLRSLLCADQYDLVLLVPYHGRADLFPVDDLSGHLCQPSFEYLDSVLSFLLDAGIALVVFAGLLFDGLVLDHFLHLSFFDHPDRYRLDGTLYTDHVSLHDLSAGCVFVCRSHFCFYADFFCCLIIAFFAAFIICAVFLAAFLFRAAVIAAVFGAFLFGGFLFIDLFIFRLFAVGVYVDGIDAEFLCDALDGLAFFDDMQSLHLSALRHQFESLVAALDTAEEDIDRTDRKLVLELCRYEFHAAVRSAQCRQRVCKELLCR